MRSPIIGFIAIAIGYLSISNTRKALGVILLLDTDERCADGKSVMARIVWISQLLEPILPVQL